MDIKGTSTIIWCPNLTKGQKIGLHLIHKRILLINLMVTAKSLYHYFFLQCIRTLEIKNHPEFQQILGSNLNSSLTDLKTARPLAYLHEKVVY